jgi:hypothetical protein
MFPTTLNIVQLNHPPLAPPFPCESSLHTHLPPPGPHAYGSLAALFLNMTQSTLSSGLAQNIDKELLGQSHQRSDVFRTKLDVAVNKEFAKDVAWPCVDVSFLDSRYLEIGLQSSDVVCFGEDVHVYRDVCVLPGCEIEAIYHERMFTIGVQIPVHATVWVLEPIEAIKPLLRTELEGFRDSFASYPAQECVEGINRYVPEAYERDAAKPEEAG